MSSTQPVETHIFEGNTEVSFGSRKLPREELLGALSLELVKAGDALSDLPQFPPDESATKLMGDILRFLGEFPKDTASLRTLQSSLQNAGFAVRHNRNR